MLVPRFHRIDGCFARAAPPRIAALDCFPWASPRPEIRSANFLVHRFDRNDALVPFARNRVLFLANPRFARRSCAAGTLSWLSGAPPPRPPEQVRNGAPPPRRLRRRTPRHSQTWPNFCWTALVTSAEPPLPRDAAPLRGTSIGSSGAPPPSHRSSSARGDYFFFRFEVPASAPASAPSLLRS